jgi:hypothetical protein
MIVHIKSIVGGFNSIVYISVLVSIVFAIATFLFNFYFAKIVGRYFLPSVLKSNRSESLWFYLIIDFFTILGVLAVPIYFFDVFKNGYDSYISDVYPLHMSIVLLGMTFGLRRGLLDEKSRL